MWWLIPIVRSVLVALAFGWTLFGVYRLGLWLDRRDFEHMRRPDALRAATALCEAARELRKCAEPEITAALLLVHHQNPALLEWTLTYLPAVIHADGEGERVSATS